MKLPNSMPSQVNVRIVHFEWTLQYCIFIITRLWLTSHPRSTVVLLDTGTPGTSPYRKIMAKNY